MMTFQSLPLADKGAQPERDAHRLHGACGMAVAIAAAFCNRSEADIASRTRSSAPICEARHIAIYLAHVVFQCPSRQVAEALRRDRTSVSHALRRVEDRRDDPQFDAFLARMERFAESCRSMMTAEWGTGR